MAAGDPLIRLEKVCFAYQPGEPVLVDVDLELREGERLGLEGPIGCGKTTCLHLMVGLLRPQAGSVWAFGRKRLRERDFIEVRGRAGLVMQYPDDQLFCPTVLEDVAFGPLNVGRSRDQAYRLASSALATVGLPGFEKRITHRLSGGEKRLVALAAVLAMEPEVLLLDEPTNGLDETSCEHISRVLAQLPQAMIVVSHQRDFLSPLVSRTQRLGPVLLVDEKQRAGG